MAAVIARGFVLAGSIAAIVWAVTVFPVFQSEVARARMASHIIAGEPYKTEILDEAMAPLEKDGAVSRPSMLSKFAIIQERRVEEAFGKEGETSQIDAKLASLEKILDRALAGSPNDSFLWLLRFWAGNLRNGFSPASFALLRMSYKTGPNEGWIAAKRNRYVAALIAFLPPDLRDDAKREFFGLVRSGDYAGAAETLAALSQADRRVFLAPLKELGASERSQFAKYLYDRNLDSVPVPGVDRGPSRPWR
jgi:hypothetical protein